jgi:CRISPR-associated protein Cas1
MKHILVTEYAEHLRLEQGMLSVWHEGKKQLEYPLSKIKTITVCRRGVGLSSDLIVQCALRGIRLFFLDFRGIQVAGVLPLNTHAVSKVRKAQFSFMESLGSRETARAFVFGKIHNQQAVLKYFGKYMRKKDVSFSSEQAQKLLQGIGGLEELLQMLKGLSLDSSEWRNHLLGIEGKAASLYWETLKSANLLASDFLYREGRGALTLTNQALNFGYSVLLSMVWHCLVNAGLEIYEGCLHTFRPGKPALVLDMMEEYRAWVVDRVVIKNRAFLEKKKEIDTEVKQRLLTEIYGIFGKKYPYHGKRVKLENILQRQVYRLSATFQGQKVYKPYLFRW